jgi:hypothetical protein
MPCAEMKELETTFKRRYEAQSMLGGVFIKGCMTLLFLMLFALFFL